MKKFYPILIGVHDRFEKYKKCIKSILSCTEAKNTNLYIASDGPNSNEAIFKVKKIRKYSKKIKGFASVTVLNRNNNLGMHENYNSALNYIKKKGHKGVIVLEDDVIVSKSFLKFMNHSLHRYYNDKKIYFISTYLTPNIGKKYSFLKLCTFASYGNGLWFNKEFKYNLLVSNINKIHNWFKNKKNFKLFETISPCNVRTLPFILFGSFRPGDILRTIFLLINNKYTLFPHVALSTNTGFDGSGVHSPNLKKFTHSKLTQSINYNIFLRKPVLDKSIELKLGEFQMGTFVTRKYLRYFNFLIYFFLINNKFSRFHYRFYSVMFIFLRKIKNFLVRFLNTTNLIFFVIINSISEFFV